MASKIKALFETHKDLIFNALILTLVGTLSFGIGRLSVIYNSASKVDILYQEANGAGLPPLIENEPVYIGSKTGSVYHFPWCPGALTMKQENKLYFQSREEAEAKGYRPAGNCKGL